MKKKITTLPLSLETSLQIDLQSYMEVNNHISLFSGREFETDLYCHLAENRRIVRSSGRNYKNKKPFMIISSKSFQPPKCIV